MLSEQYKVDGIVHTFDGVGGWHYVLCPVEYTDIFKPLLQGGIFVPITATLNDTTWETTLMLLDKKQFFIAIKASVRKIHKIKKGSKVHITFYLRDY